MNFKIISLVPYYSRPWYHYTCSFSRRINYARPLASQFICGNCRSVGDQSQVRIPAVTWFNYREFRANGSYRIISNQTSSAIILAQFIFWLYSQWDMKFIGILNMYVQILEVYKYQCHVKLCCKFFVYPSYHRRWNFRETHDSPNLFIILFARAYLE